MSTVELSDEGLGKKHTGFRRVVMTLILLAAATLGAAFIIAVVRVIGKYGWHDIVVAHFAATVGLPCAALASLFVVLFLEAKSGRIEFEIWQLKFKGASGEVVLFVFVFLSLALAIKMIWHLG